MFQVTEHILNTGGIRGDRGGGMSFPYPEQHGNHQNNGNGNENYANDKKIGKRNKIDENYQSDCEKIRFENFVEIGDEHYGNEKENYAEKVCTNGEENGENHKKNNEKIGGKTEKINNI